MTFYLTLKILHIVAALVWLGGMIAAAGLALRAKPGTDLAWLHGWFRRWNGPAMIVTLLAGLYMAQTGGLLGAPWVLGKLGLVLVLTALHGVISGRLRKAAHWAPGGVPALSRWMAPALVAIALCIVGLAVIRPA